MANQFECPDGHKFSADATHRAFCPTCGKSAKRIFLAGETPPSEEQPLVADQPKNDETPPKQPHKVKRVKVPAKKKPVESVSEQTPARKVKIKKRKAAPIVKKKVVTTRQRKHQKQQKEEHATHWTTFKTFKII